MYIVRMYLALNTTHCSDIKERTSDSLDGLGFRSKSGLPFLQVGDSDT